MSKKRQRSLRAYLPLPSAMLSGIDVDARSSWSLTSPTRTAPSRAAAPAVASGSAAGRPAVNLLAAYLDQLFGQGLASVEAALTALGVSINSITSGSTSSGKPTGTPTSGNRGSPPPVLTSGGLSSGNSTAGKGTLSRAGFVEALWDTLFVLVFDSDQPGS
jgi:hypothetical protein